MGAGAVVEGAAGAGGAVLREGAEAPGRVVGVEARMGVQAGAPGATRDWDWVLRRAPCGSLRHDVVPFLSRFFPYLGSFSSSSLSFHLSTSSLLLPFLACWEFFFFFPFFVLLKTTIAGAVAVAKYYCIFLCLLLYSGKMAFGVLFFFKSIVFFFVVYFSMIH